MIELRRGDEFAVQGTGIVSKSIIGLSKLFSLQSKAEYSHTGIILNSEGKTVEALYSGHKISNLDKYHGLKILIVRRRLMFNKPVDPMQLEFAIDEVKDFVGKPYPYWRILLHTVPLLSKLNLIKIPVCSETVMFFKAKLHSQNLKWNGYKPFRVVMDWRLQFSGNYDLIYEGVFDKNLIKEE